jgi:antitoxin YefM
VRKTQVCRIAPWSEEAAAMNAVTLKEAKRNLEQLVEQVIADAEPTIVVTENGDRVVLLSLDEYNSWKETLYLLASPANAEHLRQSLAQAKRVERKSESSSRNEEADLHAISMGGLPLVSGSRAEAPQTAQRL